MCIKMVSTNVNLICSFFTSLLFSEMNPVPSVTPTLIPYGCSNSLCQVGGLKPHSFINCTVLGVSRLK